MSTRTIRAFAERERAEEEKGQVERLAEQLRECHVTLHLALDALPKHPVKAKKILKAALQGDHQ